MGPHLVMLALAGLGLALGWRLTPAPQDRGDVHGIARLLQLGIAVTGLVILALLMIPFVMTLGAIDCTPEAERAGTCLLGVQERGLFGAGAFSCLIGVGFAFVLRNGVFDFIEDPAPMLEPAATKQSSATPTPERSRSETREPELDAEPSEPEPDAPEPDAPEPDAPEPDAPEQSEAQRESSAASSHRRLAGPVFQAFVDDHTVDLEDAIMTAATRLRSERVAVVFSRGASKDANEACLALAETFNAYRYVLEGTAAATEGLQIGDKPDPQEADEIAGPDARHAMELALDLAGGLVETVFLLDTRVAFPEFVLGQLTILQSVCIAHAHDEVSAACQVLLPGTNSGEKEGELVDDGGGLNQRRSRAWLVERLVAQIRSQPESEAATADATDDEPPTPEPSQAEPPAITDEPAKPEPAA